MSLKDIKGGEALRKFVLDDLKRMQEMSLEDKITRTKLLIKEWYEYFDGKVAISFSGGKDSTVLLHIARQIYPDIPAVYFDTGLEYPEVREHVKTFDNVEWIKPKKTFKQVVLEYGYPVVSKETSRKIHDLKHTKSEVMRRLRLEGIRQNGTYSPRSIMPKKWICLWEQNLIRAGYDHGRDFQFMAWVHDEGQIACRTKEIAEDVVRIAQNSMREAQSYFGFRVQLDTEGKIGKNWCDCH